MFIESSTNISSIIRILKVNIWHPYKLHTAQHQCEDDSERRMKIFEWAIRKLNYDAKISSKILFTHDGNFYVEGEIKRQNIR